MSVRELQNPETTLCDGDCCRTTDDGGTICLTSIAMPTDSQVIEHKSQNLWSRMRGGVMFGVGCLLSPCCTPLIVPVILSLLAGTPMAALLGQYIGWVYGGLTLFSVVSFVLAYRWGLFDQAR